VIWEFLEKTSIIYSIMQYSYFQEKTDKRPKFPMALVRLLKSRSGNIEVYGFVFIHQSKRN